MFTAEEYLEKITKRLEANFKFDNSLRLFDVDFDLVAVFKDIAGRTFISKADVIDKMEKNERLYLKHIKSLTARDLMKCSMAGIKWAEEFRPSSMEHMSTIINIVIYSDEIDDEALKWLRKFSYTKYYAFSFKGWCEVRFIVVDLKNNIVHSCKKSENIKHIFDLTIKNIETKEPNKVLSTLGKLFH